MEAEFGSSENVRFGGMKVTLHDEQGNEIKPPMCECGQVCDTCIMGVKYHTWKCNKCMYGEQPEVKFIYKKPSQEQLERFEKIFGPTL